MIYIREIIQGLLIVGLLSGFACFALLIYHYYRMTMDEERRTITQSDLIAFLIGKREKYAPDKHNYHRSRVLIYLPMTLLLVAFGLGLQKLAAWLNT